MKKSIYLMFLCLIISGSIAAQKKDIKNSNNKKESTKNEKTTQLKSVTLDQATTKLLKTFKTDIFKFDKENKLVAGDGFVMYHIQETKEIVILNGDIQYSLFGKKRGKGPKAVDIGRNITFRCSSPDPNCKVCEVDGDYQELYCKVDDCDKCASSIVIPEGATVIIEKI